MKAIKSGLAVLVVALALVSSGLAYSWSYNNDNPAVSVDPAGFKDADRPGHLPTGSPYPCIASPAYLDYTDALAATCSLKEKARRVPEPMGSPGF